MNNSKYNKSDLEKLIFEDKLSYIAIGKIYGVSCNAIKKAAKKLGISLPNKRRISEKENFKRNKDCLTNKLCLVNQFSDNDFIDIINKSKSWKDIKNNFGYNSKLTKNIKKTIELRCELLQISLNLNLNNLLSKTKGELFNNRKNWQSARSAIQKNARNVFKNKNKQLKCYICGYDKHVEIAHIKPVSEFDDNTTIAEINNIDNLIALCPNHHWEYDNGFLKISKK